jgi:hypothetical protein
MSNQEKITLLEVDSPAPGLCKKILLIGAIIVNFIPVIVHIAMIVIGGITYDSPCMTIEGIKPVWFFLGFGSWGVILSTLWTRHMIFVYEQQMRQISELSTEAPYGTILISNEEMVRRNKRRLSFMICLSLSVVPECGFGWFLYLRLDSMTCLSISYIGAILQASTFTILGGGMIMVIVISLIGMCLNGIYQKTSEFFNK